MIAVMTEIIAHRGASREFPENTLAAFARALEQGADGIELDVHATRDGVVIVHHDALVSEAPGSPGGRARALSAMSSAQVSTIRLSNGEPIPTLDDALALIGNRAAVYVEVKAAAIEQALVRCLDRHPAARCAVHSFDHRIPMSVRAARSGTLVGLLSASYPLDVASQLGPAHADAWWQQADLIDAALVQAVHAEGARVIAWTVNDPARARALIAIGVDALCTDTPGILRARLAG